MGIWGLEASGFFCMSVHKTHEGVSETRGYLLFEVLIIRILLFRVLYSGP